VGEAVPGWSGARLPERVVLVGDEVRLEPVAARHVGDLFESLCGPEDDALWTYRLQERPGSEEQMGSLVAAAGTDDPEVTFAVVSTALETALGLATLMRVDAAHGTVEVGSIVLSRRLQRTRAATEALALVIRHVFEDLGYRRLEWKCDSRNEPSRVAASRLGFSYEGRFRQAMVYKGRNRDTDWFCLLDSEWPALGAAYDAWLATDNFDGSGTQRSSLSALTAAARATLERP
jgi:RimJ/RimL family protein N-acetyltransferase